MLGCYDEPPRMTASELSMARPTYRTTPPPSVSSVPLAKTAEPHELSGALGAFTWQATAQGYRIFHDGAEVVLGQGQASVLTNAQRAVQALHNRGVVQI